MVESMVRAIRAAIERSPHPVEIRKLLEGDSYETLEAGSHVLGCTECSGWLQGTGMWFRVNELRELLLPEPTTTPMPEDGPCCRDWPHLYG